MSAPKKTPPSPLEPAKPFAKRPSDPVQEASEESFPASDAPGRNKPAAEGQAQDRKGAEIKNPADKIKPRSRFERQGPDKVAEASEESFPASDAPAWGSSHV